MCYYIGCKIIINPFIWRKFSNNLMISIPPHYHSINIFCKFRICINVISVITLSNQPFNTAFTVCDISVKAHCYKQTDFFHRSLYDN